MKNFTPLALLPVLLAVLGACVTYEAVPLGELAEQIAPGNRVIVTTCAGAELRFEVQAIDVDERALVGKSVRVPFDDVALIERRQIHWGRSIGLLLGTALVVIGLVGLAASALYG